MQQYELLFILPGTLGDTDVLPAVEAVRSVVSEKGGKIISFEDLGKSRLAYPMRHIRYGYFRLCRFEAESRDVVEIQAKLRLLKDVLRVLIQKLDPKNVGMNTIQFVPVQTERLAETAILAGDTTQVETVVAKTEAVPAPVVEDKRIKLEDIDKKLDEIMEKDIASQL